ncbi:hypothetical protein [Paludibacterium yongneupense]|uniref:hypothetical protein n=1 Tax=Paludibacterium yongneupense TaxID=400061 RepID=UPI0003F98875|nr:hypothetical protein [Paludibacterium yongneupense]
MILGAVGSFISTSGGAILKAGSSVVSEVASVVEAHPAIAAIAIGYEAYEYLHNGSSSSADSVGSNVNTSA